MQAEASVSHPFKEIELFVNMTHCWQETLRSWADQGGHRTATQPANVSPQKPCQLIVPKVKPKRQVSVSESGTICAEEQKTTKGSAPGAKATLSHKSKCRWVLVTLIEKVVIKFHLITKNQEESLLLSHSNGKDWGGPSGMHALSQNVGEPLRGFTEVQSAAD